MKLILLGVILIYSVQSFALVDYSDSEGEINQTNSVRNSRTRNVIKRTSPAPSNSSVGSSGTGMFSVDSYYESLNVKMPESNSKMGIIGINTHFQTDYNIFLDAKFQRLDSDDKLLSPSSSGQNGNPTLILGFNWLQFGSGPDAAAIDIYGGANFSSKSELASSRLDKIVGVETTKRFYVFALSLGYEYWLTGSPSKIEEKDVGNIGMIKASVGWMATPDIHFAVEGATVSVKGSDDEARLNKLSYEERFSYIKPFTRLRISSRISLKMGAIFRTDRIKNSNNITQAKLWNIHGSYGNSLFAGLDVSI